MNKPITRSEFQTEVERLPMLRSRSSVSPQIRTVQPPYAEMHPQIYRVYLLIWAFFLAVLCMTFASSAKALFMLAGGTFYGIVYFGLPVIFSRMAPKRARQPSAFGDFLHGEFQTIYGPVRGMDAFLQVISVPLAIAVASIAIACVIHAARLAS